MKTKHLISLFLTCLLMCCNGWLFTGLLHADSITGTAMVSARDVSEDLAVRDAAIAFQDVTEAYSRHLAGGRGDEDHYFMRSFGDASADYGRKGILTSDGGYVIAGQTTMHGAGENDIYLMKFDGSGVPLWSRVAGGSGGDGAAGVCETADGDLVVAGYRCLR
jgi:hypothetical protein